MGKFWESVTGREKKVNLELSLRELKIQILFYLLKSDHTNLIAVNRSTSLLNTSEHFGTFENLYEINNYNDSTSLSRESR